MVACDCSTMPPRPEQYSAASLPFCDEVFASNWTALSGQSASRSPTRPAALQSSSERVWRAEVVDGRGLVSLPDPCERTPPIDAVRVENRRSRGDGGGSEAIFLRVKKTTFTV